MIAVSPSIGVGVIVGVGVCVGSGVSVNVGDGDDVGDGEVAGDADVAGDTDVVGVAFAATTKPAVALGVTEAGVAAEETVSVTGADWAAAVRGGVASRPSTSGLAKAPVVRVVTAATALVGDGAPESARSGAVAATPPSTVSSVPLGAASGPVLAVDAPRGTPATKKPRASNMRDRA
jgi:hypothetical protein